MACATRITHLQFNSCITIFIAVWAALNETLDAEVRRLRRAVSELGRESLTSCMDRQLAINQQMFQLQHQQPSQHKHFLLQNHHNQEEIQSWSQQIQGNELHPQAQIQ